MTQPTQNPDYLSVLLAGTQAASQRDAWKARCEALQAELVTQEVRHREEVDGLQADLEDMSAQRQHWVRVAQGEMARRGEVQENTAEERDWYRRTLAKARVEVKRLTEKLVETQAERDQLRATATAWVRVSRRVWHKGASDGELGRALRDAEKKRDEYCRALDLEEQMSTRLRDEWNAAADERDQYRALAAAWETTAYDLRVQWPYGQPLPASFQKAVELSDAAVTPPASEQGENAAHAQEPTGDGNAPWTPCPEYLELGRVSYAAWCVRFYDGADTVPGVARWSQQGQLSQESWAYVACCLSSTPLDAQVRAQTLRVKYADNDVFQHTIQ